jgi:hypothetical protein
LQDQPLLLEDLLEQEKREQELQQHAQSNLQQEPKLTSVNNSAPTESSSSLLSDTDFEHLKVDVLGSPSTGPGGLMPHAKPSGINDVTNLPKSAFFGTLGCI